VTKYVYSMMFTAEKIAGLIEAAIGRRPDEIGASGNRGMSFTFNGTDIVPTERQAALDALPEFIRQVYNFTRTVIEEGE